MTPSSRRAGSSRPPPTLRASTTSTTTRCRACRACTHSLCACLIGDRKGVPGMNARSWIAAYAERLGADAPTRDEFEAILALAAEAAHSSERVAAPVACWVAAKAGVPLTDAVEAARGIDEAARGIDEAARGIDDAAAPRSSGGALPPPRSQ